LKDARFARALGRDGARLDNYDSRFKTDWGGAHRRSSLPSPESEGFAVDEWGQRPRRPRPIRLRRTGVSRKINIFLLRFFSSKQEVRIRLQITVAG
jgi:hypothetical protein